MCCWANVQGRRALLFGDEIIRPLPAVLLAAACTSCGIADGASNSIGQASSDVPETLSAAVAAAQANADRFSSGDFAGVWERMSREVRDGITREDFRDLLRNLQEDRPEDPGRRRAPGRWGRGARAHGGRGHRPISGHALRERQLGHEAHPADPGDAQPQLAADACGLRRDEASTDDTRTSTTFE